MENLKLFTLFFITLIGSSCSDQNKKVKTKLKGDFVFENKTSKNKTFTVNDSIESEVKSEKLMDKREKLNFKKIDTTVVQHTKKVISEKLKGKEPILIEDPIKIPEKWSNAYSKDQKWMGLYDETSNAFLTGWSNEFMRNPNAKISREELLLAYRKRMEKIFFETPSFIEFCVSELGNSDKFKTFVSDYKSNVH